MASGVVNNAVPGRSRKDNSSDEECLPDIKNNHRRPPEDPDEKMTPMFDATVKVKIESCDSYDGENVIDYTNPSLFESSTTYITEESQCSAEVMDYSPHKRRCVKCGDSFRTPEELGIHLHTHLEGETYSCHICHKKFQQKHMLEHHLDIHRLSMVNCPQCPVIVPDQTRIQYHLKLYHEAIKICPTCGYDLVDLKDFYVHMNKYHSVQTSNLCIYCGCHFLSNDERNTHIEEVHSHEAGCKKCGSKYICFCPAEDVPVKSEDNNSVTEKDKIEENVSKTVNMTFDMTIDIKQETSPIPGTSDQAFETPPNDQFDSSFKIGDLTHQTKCAIVTKMHKGKTVADICKLYNLAPELVNDIWQQRDSIVIPKKIGMKSSKYMNSVLDGKILEWFYKQRELGVQITGKMLINIAEEYAKECGFVVFNGNIKWLDRFKTRHKISLRPNQVRKEKVMRAPNDAKWKEQFLNEIWPEVSKGFDFEDIYTADEVGVFYNPSKGRIRKHTGRKYIHGFDKDRFSILLCTNMTGRDRKRLLVCGTCDPLPHSHRDPNTLPVTYIRHSQAQFTTDIFEDYVKTWNIQLQLQNKRALLILDRVSIHSKLPLTHLKLVFVPWKASTGLMPIKHGIYTKFRDEFRRLILQQKAMTISRGIDRNLTCLEGIEMVHKAWNRVPCSSIIDGFRVIGYHVPENLATDITTPKVSEDDDSKMCKLMRDYNVDEYYTDVANMDMYLTVDEDLLTAQGTNGSVFGGNHKVPEQITETGEILPIAANKVSMVDRQKAILKIRAIDDLAIIRKYLQSKATSFNTFTALLNIEKSIHKAQLKKPE